MQRYLRVLSGILLSWGSLTTIAIADTAPATVRIATFAYVDKGQVKIGGNSYYGRVINEGWLASELAKRGIKLEWVPIAGNDTGPVINEAFASHRIDFATYGDLPSMILNTAGIHTRVIVPNGHGTDVALLVPPGSNAKSLRDLKGKRISVHRSRPWELSMIKLLQQQGLSSKDFQIINMQPQAGAAALASGNVDALFDIGNSAYNLADKHVGKIIWTSREFPVARIRAELWGTQDFIDLHPELTQVVADAFVRAQYWASLPENQATILQQGTRSGTPESVVRHLYDDPSLPWKDHWSPRFDELLYSQYRGDIETAFATGLIRKKLRVEDLLEPRFVEKSLKNQGLDNYWQAWGANNVIAGR